MAATKLLACGTLTCMSGVFLLAASCLSSRIVGTIPPANLTETRLLVTYNRIQNYWNQHGEIPAKPADLLDEKNRDCSMTDAWGRKLHWDSDGKSAVKVWSLGSDGKLGGTNENSDMEVEFVGKYKGQEDLPTIKRGDSPQNWK